MYLLLPDVIIVERRLADAVEEVECEAVLHPTQALASEVHFCTSKAMANTKPVPRRVGGGA